MTENYIEINRTPVFDVPRIFVTSSMYGRTFYKVKFVRRQTQLKKR